jgi:hypothetical protein
MHLLLIKKQQLIEQQPQNKENKSIRHFQDSPDLVVVRFKKDCQESFSVTSWLNTKQIHYNIEVH